jgi:hypothetical protein
MLDVEMFGLDAGGHHFTNLVFHLLNTALLLFVLARASGAFWPSALVALLFAIHPAHVESVAWVAERKDVLSTFFFLLAIAFYLAYVQTRSLSHYLVVFILLVLGLMSKPMLVTFPFVLLLLDYWPLKRFKNSQHKAIVLLLKLLLEKLPFFLAVLAMMIITFLIQQDSGAMSAGSTLDFLARIENALVSYVRYVGVAVLPVDLTVFYPHPGSWPSLTVWLSLLMLILVSTVAVILIKTKPYFFVGWFFFLGTLVPVIGLVQVGAQSLADRYTYIPFIGLFIMFAWSLAEIYQAYPRIKSVIVMGVLGVVASLLLATMSYLPYWKYDALLFKHTLKIHDPGYEALLQRGISENKPREVYSGLSGIYLNLGMSLFEVGLDNEAEIHLIEALRIKPDMYNAYYVLGQIYLDMKRYQSAYNSIAKALELHPQGRETFERELADITLLMAAENKDAKNNEK